MNLPFSIYRVFDDVSQGLSGNTSPVFILKEALSKDQMQKIAADLWQPATTFLIQDNTNWQVRWFAPDQEIKLCGHGSMAAVAHLNSLGYQEVKLQAETAEVHGGHISDTKCFIDMKPIPVTEELHTNAYLEDALGIPVLGHFRTENKHIVLTDTEYSVQHMVPDFAKLRESEIFGYSVTAPADHVDFVSRTLVPHVHQLEDPATGSSHAALAPYWGIKLNKSKMTAIQLSKRGGLFEIAYQQDKVRLTGNYVCLTAGASFTLI